MAMAATTLQGFDKMDDHSLALVSRNLDSNLYPGNIKKHLIWWAIKLQIFYFACIILKRPNRIWRAYNDLTRHRHTILGGELRKIHKVDSKYYFNIYTPGWPSMTYNRLIKNMLGGFLEKNDGVEKLSFIFLAITRKCPMRCEHCFEWNNLNKPESFTKNDLLKVIDAFLREGVAQFHFSGGEPIVRMNDLIEVIQYASKKSECWVLTSGFNLTYANALLLKKAGCKGVVVSIDHYLPAAHNLFRGHARSFENAVQAVQAARRAGLVVAISVCATKSFIDGQHILPYMDFAKNLGVHFVQMLEPKNVGHYEGKDVLLEQNHIDELETVFKTVNYGLKFQDYPILLYHGYHQRRIGCLTGRRSVYVDSAGDVHACPFCHTKSYNIISLIREGIQPLVRKENGCARYEKIA